MKNEWNQKFAFYAVALYRVGNYTDAALVGSIMFEKAVYILLDAKGIKHQLINKTTPQNKGVLQYAIHIMCQKYSKYNENDIQEIRKNIRNEITHEIEIYHISRKKIWPMLYFIWEVLDTKSFQKYKGNVDAIDFLTADYAVVDIRELFNENLQDVLAEKHSFQAFGIKDFEELYLLREKMISLGARIKQEILKVKFKNELYIDIISNINTTSAYVWMSMNLHNSENRERINSASVSILTTPLDLRIYFDIGGGAYQVRQDYYKFLRSEYFKNFLTHIDLEGIELFDNDWYCFIVQRTPLVDFDDQQIGKQIEEAEEKLLQYQDKIITWNRLLFGYILERGDITFDEIESKLRIIIDMYYCFESFRQKELGREKVAFNYNVMSMCKPKVKAHKFTLETLKI
jgi:hypothetical protein